MGDALEQLKKCVFDKPYRNSIAFELVVEDVEQLKQQNKELNTDWCKCASLNAQLNIKNKKLQAQIDEKDKAIRELKKEISRLREYEAMYNQLSEE